MALSAEPKCVRPGAVVLVSIKQRDDRFEPAEDGWLVEPSGREWKDAMIPAHENRPHEPYLNPDPAAEIRYSYSIPSVETRWAWRRHLTVPSPAGQGTFRFVWGFYDNGSGEHTGWKPATHEAVVEFDVNEKCPA